MDIPVVPGHASADELMAFLFNPSNRVDSGKKTLAPAVSQNIIPMTNRVEIIFQVQSGGPVWVNVGGSVAVVGEGFKLEGVLSLELAGNIPISIISSVATSVYVLQMGAQ